MTFWLIIICVSVVVAYIAFGKSKLSLRLRGAFNRTKDDVTNKIGRGADEQQERIRAAKVDSVEFKRSIAKFTAEAKRLEAEHAKHVSGAEKWGNIADRAAEKGDAANVTRCLQHKKNDERLAASLFTQIGKNTESLEQLHAQVQEQDQHITEHEVSSSLLAARESSLRMREKMVSSSGAFGGKDSLGDLDAYQRQVDEREWELEAMEGMSNEDADLEKKYGDNGDAGLADETAALMAKFKKESV